MCKKRSTVCKTRSIFSHLRPFQNPEGIWRSVGCRAPWNEKQAHLSNNDWSSGVRWVVQLQLLEEPVLRPDGRQRHHVESGASHRAELQKSCRKPRWAASLLVHLRALNTILGVQSFVLKICQSLSIRLLPEPESPSKPDDSKGSAQKIVKHLVVSLPDSQRRLYFLQSDQY
jgi:hypothetical protein